MPAEFRPQLLARVVRILGGLLLAIGAYAITSQLAPLLLPTRAAPAAAGVAPAAVPRGQSAAAQRVLRGLPLFGNFTR